jgi:bifunctional UDP-N-acetylglucosamine pyrophosphorylase / glucosamine-1-phosphate N-acetyltransferase
MNTSLNLVILAAGLGTRMKSKQAKVLHRAGGLSLIEHVVATAKGITPPECITVVVGHQAAEVRKVLAHTGVRFVEQKDQKGTGHALMMCRESLVLRGGMIGVVYGDCPLLARTTLQQLVDRQRSSDAGATMITTRLQDPTGYGRIILGDRGHVQAIVEQKAANPEQLTIQVINPGIYCFRADLLWKHIGELQTNNPAQEYYLTDMVEILNRAGHTVEAIEVPDANQLLGINTRVELAAADKIFRDRKVQELMLSGVTIEKPETVTIDSAVQIGMDTVIEPFVQILGNSAIGEDCRIGAASILSNSKLADRVHIGPFTSIVDSAIDANAAVGPFARLRGGAHIAVGAHIGNFVELKNTEFGAGAKANHLAYLGDAEIGAKTNIGAGTITCNFDGVTKHRTKIGEAAFVGSNSTLVAPVEIGEGSYIGAGSVITRPVPAGALALARERQVHKEGWAAARKKKKE